MTSITADGATDTIYILETDGTAIYRVNSGMWFGLTFPLTVANTNGTPASNILKVLFISDITITSDIGYITVGSDGIQIGNTTVKDDGTKVTITIDGVPNYPGFVDNSGHSDVYVYNLKVNATNGSYLPTGGGWIGQYRYGVGATNNFIIGCSSNGPIQDYSGGIVGAEASAGEGSTSSLTIAGCTSSGTIGDSAGGIVGEYAGYNGGEITIFKCSSSGDIGNSGGGIFAVYAGQGSGSALANKCYSIGTIGGDAGGIYGQYAGEGGQAIATNCYSRGTIGVDGGAIFGANAAATSGDDIPGVTIATYCYGIGSGAIYGTGASESASSTSVYMANPWSDSAALAAGLSLIDYISTGINIPYELRNIGPSPYSLTTVGDEADMSFTFSESVAAGSSSIAAVLAGLSSFSILEIDGESPAETPTITINATTGVISTTSETFVGTYTIVVRAVTNPYSITTFELTVTEGPPAPPTPTSTTSTNPIGFKRLDYSEYGNLLFGQRLVQERLSNVNVRFNSYADYLKYKIARATINTK